jgi:hypothetical protein
MGFVLRLFAQVTVAWRTSLASLTGCRLLTRDIRFYILPRLTAPRSHVQFVSFSRFSPPKSLSLLWLFLSTGRLAAAAAGG